MTGASDGIGRAVASELAHRGASVLAVARDRRRLDDLSRSHVAVLAADLATTEGRQALFARVGDQETLESLVHAAGSRVPAESYGAIDPERLVEDFRIHVAAVLAINQRLADRARRVVVFDSYSALSPRVGWAGYSIVKAAAQMAARALEEEVDGPEVLRLYPGAVRTPLVESILGSEPSPARDAFRSLEVEGRVAEPEEIGRWVADILESPPGGATVRHFDQETRPGTGPVPEP